MCGPSNDDLTQNVSTKTLLTYEVSVGSHHLVRPITINLTCGLFGHVLERFPIFFAAIMKPGIIR